MWPTHYLPRTPREGIPPPRFYLTTPPYPLEVVEEMAAAAEFQFATPGVGTDEEITAAAQFVSGLVTSLGFVAYEFDDELESAALFVSGTVTLLGFVIGQGNDELESAAQFISGALEEPLIIYDNWPLGADTEDMLGSAAFVSGVLT
jgi:hypothetical protein